MKKLSQAQLKKMVSEKGLEVSRGKIPKKEPEKKLEKKPEKPDLTSGIMVKSGQIVIGMAESLAVSADKMAESNVMVAKIAQTIQKDLNKPVPVQEKPKKRKWKFTPHRNYDGIIQHIIVTEI